MVETGNECLHTAHMFFNGDLQSLLRRSVVPAKFLLGTSTQRETPNVLVVVWSGNEARHGWRNVTVHRLSAHSQDLLFTAHIHDGRLYPSKRSETIHALIISSCVVSSRVLRRPHQGPLQSPHFAHGCGARDYSTRIDGSA